MTLPPAPSPPPIVLRQRWVVVIGSSTYDAGYSYHLTETDREAFVSEAMSLNDRLDAAEREFTGHEEPLGEPELFQTTEVHVLRVKQTRHGQRAR